MQRVQLLPAFVLAVLLSILSVLSLGCDAFLTMEGTVYGWTDAPKDANSQVYVNEYVSWKPPSTLTETVPQGTSLVPLSSAALHFVISADGKPAWDYVRIGDNQGNFSTGPSYYPRSKAKYVVSVEVTTPGYRAVTREFGHNGQRHELVIVLVPAAQP